MTNWIKDYGSALVSLGYTIIPIIPFDADHGSAGKAPALKDWRDVRADKALVRKWAKSKPRSGIGINTTFNPAVDIDTLDEEAAEYMISYIEENYGFAPVRTGRPPKALMMFKASEPFTKVKSSQWVDPAGELNAKGKPVLQAVEVLADGEQFVAFGIHPSTKKPYFWRGVDDPSKLDGDFDLIELTLTDARVICDEFDRWIQANRPNWVREQRPMRGRPAVGPDDWTDPELDDGPDGLDDDDIAAISGLQWNGTYEEMTEFLDSFPNDGGYDDWIRMIAAVRSGEREEDEFRELALEWSRKSEQHDDDYFDLKWEGGKFQRVLGEVANINRIVENSEKERARVEGDALIKADVIPAFQKARTMEEWNEAAELMRGAATFGIQREAATKIAVEAFNKISDVKLTAKEITKHLVYDWSKAQAPVWLRPWVYLGGLHQMYNRRTGAVRIPQAFDAEFLPEVDGIAPSPMVFARKMRPVLAVEKAVYRPLQHGNLDGNLRDELCMIDDPDVFIEDGKHYLNTFKPDSIPPVKPDEELTDNDRRAISVVEDFFRVQFPDNWEYRHWMDWCSYLVAKPGHRINYMPLILGGESSGKTIIKKMFQALLGAENVDTVTNEVVHKSFSYWAAGSILKVIEEVQAADGTGGYDLLNKLKEPITNDRLMVEHKRQDGIQIVNTATWLGFTNDPAALPLGSDSSRYLVISSRFRTRDMADAYLIDNPRFFKDFEIAFTKHAPALRNFFSHWKRLPTFDASRRAPDTASTRQMRESSVPEALLSIRDAIENDRYIGISADLINLGALKQLYQDHRDKPAPRRLARLMSELGFAPVVGGEPTQIETGGHRGVIYAREPEKWRDGGMADRGLIKAHFNAHAKKVQRAQDAWELQEAGNRDDYDEEI